MKKVILLSIVTLVFAVSVFAQSYDVVTIDPNTIRVAVTSADEVYGTTWGQCIAVCTGQCLENKEGSREECDKMCTDKCHPQPDVITKRLLPKEDCPTMCKRLTAQGIEIFIRCMHDRCKEDCESSCREMYGNQAQNCIEKFCKPQETCEQGCDGEYSRCMRSSLGTSIEAIKRGCENVRNNCLQDKCGHPPETCEQGCGKKLNECLKTTVGINIESIRSACEKLHNECVQDQCEKPETCEQGCDKEHQICLEKTVGFSAEGIKTACDSNRKNCMIQCAPKPMSCEGRCEMIRKDCMDANIDPRSCQMKIDECKRQCKPECPPSGGCEIDCSKDYYGCMRKANLIDNPEEQQTMMANCRNMIGDCLDKCMPGMPVVHPCEEGCVSAEKECLDAGNGKERCGEMSEGCIKKCKVLPFSGKCEDVCIKIKVDCLEAGIDEASCAMKVGACMKRCKPEAKAPNCAEECIARSEKCIRSGIDRETCMGEKAKCMQDCGQAEGQAMTAGTAGEQGFFRRLWASIVG